MCSQLKEVNFNEGSKITMIACNTFENCTSLKTLKVPRHVSIISKGAFKKCVSFETIDATNVKVLTDDAFENCTSLREVKVDVRIKK
jgi:hypothetical protein